MRQPGGIGASAQNIRTAHRKRHSKSVKAYAKLMSKVLPECHRVPVHSFTTDDAMAAVVVVEY